MSELDPTELDRATASRLAKLRAISVDTTRLEQQVLARVPRRAESRRRRAWLLAHPMRAIAASVALVALISVIVWSVSGGPVSASAVQMAQLHEDMVAGRLPAERVESIDEANKLLAAQWPEAPVLPDVPQEAGPAPPSMHVMACCMRSVKNKKMACVLLHNAGVPVTMTVANAKDMKLPDVPPVLRDGFSYRVQRVGKLNMVMTERDGRWLCLIGELPAEQLMDLAARLRF